MHSAVAYISMEEGMARSLQLDEGRYTTLAVSYIASEAFCGVVVVPIQIDTGG